MSDQPSAIDCALAHHEDLRRDVGIGLAFGPPQGDGGPYADAVYEYAAFCLPLLPAVLARAEKAEAELKRLRDAWAKEAHEVQQTLGKALGYPPLYPHASEVDDGQVCVGEHVTETLAMEAARRIARIEAVLRSVTRDYPSGHLVVSVIRERLAKGDV